jgi:bifunctional ADP-heptose synthase (sugar kinase/adenylyltransferase)
VESFGGKVRFTKDITFSSSALINSSNLLFNEDQRKYLSQIKTKFGFDYILSKILEFKKINVLVLGELIFDNYIFGDVIGKSGKEPHLVFENKKSEYYVGGSGAICRHLQGFVSKVNFLSNFGNETYLKNYLKNDFSKNIFFNNLQPYSGFRSIVKTRFLDQKSNYKMFGSYSIPEHVDKNYYKKYHKFLSKLIFKNNLIVGVDYGHGLIPENIVDKINLSKKFISFSKQINASTFSTHDMMKYRGANLIVINETELRYSEKNQIEIIEKLIKKFKKKIKAKSIIVTRGKNGSIYYSKNKFYYCPAFALKSIDKVGAGDSMFSLVSLCEFNKLHPLITLLLGSLAAARSIQSIGNKSTVDKVELINNLEYVLK